MTAAMCSASALRRTMNRVSVRSERRTSTVLFSPGRTLHRARSRLRGTSQHRGQVSAPSDALRRPRSPASPVRPHADAPLGRPQAVRPRQHRPGRFPLRHKRRQRPGRDRSRAERCAHRSNQTPLTPKRRPRALGRGTGAGSLATAPGTHLARELPAISEDRPPCLRSIGDARTRATGCPLRAPPASSSAATERQPPNRQFWAAVGVCPRALPASIRLDRGRETYPRGSVER
jgi:hypothetical protein